MAMEENSLLKWKRILNTFGQSPKPRHGHKAVSINNIMIIFGGGHEGIIKDLFVYNFTSKTWSQPVVTGEIPPGRAAYGLTLVGKTKIYIFGGMLEFSKLSDDLYSLDTVRWRWSKLNTSSSRLDSTPSARLGLSLTWVPSIDKVYLFGGLTDIPNNFNGLVPTYENNLYSLSWYRGTRRSVLFWESVVTFGMPPRPRESHTCSTYKNKQTGKSFLILYGGINNNERFGDVWLLDIDSKTWIRVEIGGIPPLPRSLHTATIIGSRMYIYGGWTPLEPMDFHLREMNAVWKCSSTLACLHLDNLMWEPLNFDSSSDQPKARAGHSCVSSNSRLYVWSGQENEVCLSDLWYIDVKKPGRPGPVLFTKISSHSLEVFWKCDPNSDDYLLQIQKLNNNQLKNAASTLVRSLSKGSSLSCNNPKSKLDSLSDKLEEPSAKKTKTLVSKQITTTISSTGPSMSQNCGTQNMQDTTGTLKTSITPTITIRDFLSHWSEDQHPVFPISTDPTMADFDFNSNNSITLPTESSGGVNFVQPVSSTSQKPESLALENLCMLTSEQPGSLTSEQPGSLTSEQPCATLKTSCQVKSDYNKGSTHTELSTLESMPVTKSMTMLEKMQTLKKISHGNNKIPILAFVKTKNGKMYALIPSNNEIKGEVPKSLPKSLQLAKLKECHKDSIYKLVRISGSGFKDPEKSLLVCLVPRPKQDSTICAVAETTKKKKYTKPDDTPETIHKNSDGPSDEMSAAHEGVTRLETRVGDVPRTRRHKEISTTATNYEYQTMTSVKVSGQRNVPVARENEARSEISTVQKNNTDVHRAELSSSGDGEEKCTKIIMKVKQGDVSYQYKSPRVIVLTILRLIAQHLKPNAQLVTGQITTTTPAELEVLPTSKTLLFDRPDVDRSRGANDKAEEDENVFRVVKPFNEKALQWCNIRVLKNENFCFVPNHRLVEKDDRMEGNVEINLEQIRLKPETVYKLRVAGVNALGQGPWSVESVAKTCSESSILTPRCFKISKLPEGIHLSWNNPEDAASGDIEEYKVLLFCDGPTYRNVYQGPDNRCIISNSTLSSACIKMDYPHSFVVFRVMAKHSVRGYGSSTQVKWLLDESVSVGGRNPWRNAPNEFADLPSVSKKRKMISKVSK